MKQYTDSLDKILSEYLVKKAPVLPKNIKDILVKLAPYFAILAVIFGLPAILAVLGLGAVITPVAWVAGTRTGFFWLFWAVGLVQIVIAGMSIKPLFARAGHGWRLMYYSQLLSIISSLGSYNVGSLVFTVLSLYLLYQVKSSYK
jgi:hypothetical protein